MSGDFPFAAKIVSPVKCNEKPWDLWVSEIGHLSPRRDDEGFAAPAGPGLGAESKGARRETPHKLARRRRAGLNRLRRDAMSLHGLLPQQDDLNAAVCHMCGVVVKCSAAYRHLLESHSSTEPILPPPPPVTTVKSRSRHKKEPLPALPVDMLPVKMETSPVHTATAPISRVVMPQPDLQYMDEASTSAGVTGEVQVCVETGELPVVSIQDPEDLPLGENITDDIFAIMNSEGIQSADDIANSTDWKNIIRDIGNMPDINFPQVTEPVPPQDLYSTMHPASLSAYSIPEPDLSSLQFAPNTSPMVSNVIDTSILNPQALKPPAPSTPTTKTPSRKTGKTKFNLREYDPNKHCGVVTADNPKPCTRSLTCKAHALSLRRTVDGRAKPFDTLLAEHRAARDAAAQPPAPAPAPPAPALPPPHPALDLGAFNGLPTDAHVDDIYALLEDSGAVLPDTSGITALLSPPPPPPEAHVDAGAEAPAEERPPLVAADVCWYAACPRPLALCTFNAAHAGGAVTLGKKFATVRSNIKSSLSRSQSKAAGASGYYYGQNALSLSKTVHMNASKTNKPEVRKLIVTCGSAGAGAGKEVAQTLSELFGGEVRALNGHAARRKHAHAHAHTHAHAHAKRAPSAVLDLGFPLDVLADEKC